MAADLVEILKKTGYSDESIRKIQEGKVDEAITEFSKSQLEQHQADKDFRNAFEKEVRGRTVAQYVTDLKKEHGLKSEELKDANGNDLPLSEVIKLVITKTKPATPPPPEPGKTDPTPPEPGKPEPGKPDDENLLTLRKQVGDLQFKLDEYKDKTLPAEVKKIENTFTQLLLEERIKNILKEEQTAGNLVVPDTEIVFNYLIEDAFRKYTISMDHNTGALQFFENGKPVISTADKTKNASLNEITEVTLNEIKMLRRSGAAAPAPAPAPPATKPTPAPAPGTGINNLPGLDKAMANRQRQQEALKQRNRGWR